MQQQNDNIQQVSEVFKKLGNTEPIALAIDADAAYLLVCQWQLALRHPLNKGHGSEVIRGLARELQKSLGERVLDAIAQLEKGWHPEFDVHVELTWEDLDISWQRQILVDGFALSIACEAKRRVNESVIRRLSS